MYHLSLHSFSVVGSDIDFSELPESNMSIISLIGKDRDSNIWIINRLFIKNVMHDIFRIFEEKKGVLSNELFSGTFISLIDMFEIFVLYSGGLSCY